MELLTFALLGALFSIVEAIFVAPTTSFGWTPLTTLLTQQGLSNFTTYVILHGYSDLDSATGKRRVN